MIFPHLKNTMTVSDSVAAQYETEYGIRPVTVRNCSRKTNAIIPYLREELGIGKDHLLLILQGTGINVDRGGEELIEAVRQTDKVSLLIVGSGDLLSTLKERVKELDLSDRVKFISKVPWEELIRYTKSADAGLSIDKDTNINYRFSLPNKLFDYISAGIPVIASDLPGIKKIITENKCGIIIPKVTPEEISIAMKELRDNKDLLTELKRNAIIASESINWEKESSKIIEFYNRVLSYSEKI
jgi:glycosyltransferase involved in cell wall biosynthesis